MQDIFQILFASICLFIFVGADKIVKTIIILILSFIIKSIIFVVPKEILKKCKYSKNPWNK